MTQPKECPNCQKAPDLCVCEDVAKIAPLKSKLHVLILQHPQEPDKALGSARLANLALPNSTLRVGLSWPNLKKALGREAQPGRWAVLHLGSGIKTPEGGKSSRGASAGNLVLVDKKGVPLPDNSRILSELEGIVLLDGTWSQAKALWWRNAWLLKLRRAILIPPRKSLYGELRKEPRRECLSTIESIAYSLGALGEPEGTTKGLVALFDGLLNRYRARRKTRAPRAPETKSPGADEPQGE